MVLNILFLTVGFYLLIRGANLLVDGSTAIAMRMKVSPLVIGLTVVAFGTSAPELVVNVFSAFQGANQVAIGNILGSNMANILLVLGAAAIFKTLRVKRQTINKEIPFSLLAAVIVLVFAADIYLDGFASNMISRTEGFALLAFFLIFLYYSYGAAKPFPDEDIRGKDIISKAKSIFYIFGGLAALFVGGRVIVDNAVAIAEILNISQTIIGLTIVALGTSLPELVTSIIAVRRNEVDMAIGNIVGSNIFNIFLVLGATAIVAPIPFEKDSFVDAVIVIAASLALFAVLFVGEKRRLERWGGIMFLTAYVGYIALRIFGTV